MPNLNRLSGFICFGHAASLHAIARVIRMTGIIDNMVSKVNSGVIIRVVKTDRVIVIEIV